MSRSLGVLTLDLIAKTGNFDQGMDRARRKIGEFDNDLKGMVARLDRAAIAIAGVAAGAAAGMVALTMQTVKTMDATSKMADQIGVTTEALTGLRFSAQQFANVSDQTFDMALRRMTRRIEEAAQGAGGAKGALEALGLSAKELSQLSPDQQFLALADAMQKTDTQAQRLRHTMAIFDTEGMPLVTALAQGSEELEKNIELATRYGVVLSTQAAKSAEQFATNMASLGKIQEGYRQQLTTALLPALERASGYMLGVAESALEVGNSRSRLQSFSDAAVDMVDDIARSYAGLLEIGRGVMDMLDALDQAALGWLEPFKQETRSAASILSQSFSESVLNTAREIDKIVGFAGGVRAAWEAATSSIPGFFRQAWNNVLIGAAEFVNNLAGLVNPMLEALGMDGFSGVSWGENVVVGQRSITEAFKEGYEAAKAASGMAARVQAAYEKVGVAASNAAVAIAGTNGSGGGGRNLTGGTKAAQKAAEAFRREQDQGLRAQLQAVSAILQQAVALEDQVLLFGLGKTALEDLTIARLEEQAAILRGFDGSQEAVEAIEREIEARQRLRTAIGSLEQKEAERQQWEDWARDVEQIFDRVGQSLTDAIFDGGKSGRDLLRDMFKGLTFNILINPVMNQLQGWVTNQLGGLFGVQNPQQGGGILGMAQNANTLYQAYSGGMASNLGQGIQWIGNKIGSQALQSFATGLTGAAGAAGTVAGITSVGAGLGASLGASIGTSTAAMASTSFSAALSGGAGASMAATAGASGAAGAGAALGAALPWIGGALAIGSLLSGGFGNAPETRFGGGFHYQPGDTTAAYFGGPSGRDAGAENVIASMITDTAQSLQSIFDAIGSDVLVGVHGSAESSGKGRGGTASGGDLYIDGEIIASFGTIGKGTGFGGTSGSLEEMIQNLGVDLTHTFLEGLQAGAAFLPSTIQGMLDGIVPSDLNAEQAVAVAQHIQIVIEQVGAFQVAVESLPFATLRDLSFDAAANLISFAGGMEALDAGMSTYFQNFYSEAEQLDWLSQQLSTAFEGIGHVMPDVTQGADAAKAAYRSLVESLDVTTEEGQRAYATLMTLSGGFAELVTGLEGLNNSVGALRERESLERQWLALIGDEAELRRRDLDLLDPSNRALQEMIWLRQDEMKAADEAARVIAEAQERARAVEQERYGLETQLLQIQGDTVALRARELDALNPLNRGLQQQIWTLQDAAAAQQAYERSIQSVTGSLAGIRETVLLDQLGSDDARYGYFKQQADGLARLLPQLTDESAITQTISQIASITGRAYGLLDDEQKQSMGGEFLEYIDRTETIATRQIQAIQEGQRQAAQEQAEATAKAVAHEVGRIADAIIKSVEGMPASTANAIRNAVAQNTGQRTTQYREVEFGAEVNA